MWQIITSEQLNAPVVAEGNGQLLTMLDACLIDGFNEQSVAHYADGVLTFGGLHGYIKNQVITISDDNSKEDYRIKEVSDNQVVLYDKPQLVGQITTKITPLGWESMFGNDDPLRRAYRSKNDKSSKTVFYLDMNLTELRHKTNPIHYARVTLCEDMTEFGIPINDYSKVFSDAEKYPNGRCVIMQNKSSDISNSANKKDSNKWIVCGDDTIAMIFIMSSSFDDRYMMNIIGDMDGLDGHKKGFFYGDIIGARQVNAAANALSEKSGLTEDGVNFSLDLYQSKTQINAYDASDDILALPAYAVADTIIGKIPYLSVVLQKFSLPPNEWHDDVFFIKLFNSYNNLNHLVYGVSFDD